MDSSQEMHIFACEHLVRIIEDCIFDIMKSRDHYSRLCNLVEINLPDEKRQYQIAILDCMTRFLSEERAVDGKFFWCQQK